MSFHFLLSHACDFRFLHCFHGPSHSPIYTVSHLCPIPIFFPANHSRAFDGSMYMQILLLKICFFSFNLLFLHLTSWLIIVHGCALDHFRLPVCIHTYCNITLWNIYELSTHKHKKKIMMTAWRCERFIGTVINFMTNSLLLSHCSSYCIFAIL